MDEFQTLFDVIGVLAHRRLITMERRLSLLGFNHTEARLLTIVSQSGEITQEQAAGFLFVDRSNAGRALKSLEQGGFVVREKGEADKRKFLVRITEQGRSAASEISAIKKSVADEFFRSLSPSDAEKITALLRHSLSDDEFELRSNAPGTNFRSQSSDSAL